ncbi:hypothetical protein AN5708.2 [Aspergillus nidulans FGSC A4]|uniref:CBS domain protein (AFU_orthologue AFUA_1G06660) n=1 Tax=Emericella nidulans (strain FGSC A4 / ATCC 38163 / CBS 112.46 / NRRL 194 / M139) TaxID=227321 RepID=Q5B172_EMENI|nr:hypothetical protein [Aspergillus nidulans FGSC A4]EAA62801.1 hypothetical protein AN5708.2 [Aspergillus nidulans FGSC A4]CBF81359.1 TPA: CBS domain protein (AFU_orthologue; AFUA_1G06660) [Aspergillus nidulans FGSC A4]|eukprot:XP_663312.1 hypothetical protein AN5708.2 [Aspergillus nidulans FGSC A4]
MAEQSLEVPESSNGSNTASPRSSVDSRPPSIGGRTPRLSHASNHQHRQSFSESLRAAPGSPRARRQPSLTQAAIQSLIDNPPAPHNMNPVFAGRDWREISIGELVSPDDLRFVEVDTGIEEATNILIDTDAPVLLIRETPEHKTAVGTFDYSDLNTYLLLAAGLTRPDEDLLPAYEELARKARDNIPIPMRDVKELGRKEPLTTLPSSASLMMAVETFGGGVHRVVVIDEHRDSEVIGIVSQFRLVKFLWENGRCFPVLDQLYPQSLRDLKIGSHRVISINGDKMLSEALQLMHSEGISSVAVVDNHFNVVGNISTTDVKFMGYRSILTVVIGTSYSIALNGAHSTLSDWKHQRTVAAPISQRTGGPCAAGGPIYGRSICESGTPYAVDSSVCSAGGPVVRTPCGRSEPNRRVEPACSSQRIKPS